MLVGLDDNIVVANEVGTLTGFAKQGRIQLHHTPNYMPTADSEPRPAWWVDVFSRDTIDAERYQISQQDYDALLAAEGVGSESTD